MAVDSFPITLGGMVICPGDLVLGVIAVPQASAARILDLVRAKHEAEGRQMEAIRNGTIDRSWVDKALIDKGCEFLD
jgi:regulator of RNase E activity RraA